MQVSIIGSGFVANMHAEAILSLGHELSVIVSTNKEKAAAFATKWDIPIHGIDFDLALKNSDCIHICTPPLAHFEYAKKAILAGKHIVCEKPLSADVQEAKTLYELAEKNQTIAAVVFNARYHAACERIKQFVADKDFGSIRLIHGQYLQEFHAGSDQYHWRYITKKGGKMRAVTEIGSHWIDLVRYCTGLEIVSVAANFGYFQPQRHLTKEGMIHPMKKENSQLVDVNSEDAATISFRFSGGAIGHVVLSEVAHGRKNQLQLEIAGSEQSVWWNNEQPYQLHFGKKNEAVRTETNPFGGGFTDTFRELFRDIYTSIKTPDHRSNFPNFRDGYINAAICEAIYNSANQHSTWIDINEIEKFSNSKNKQETSLEVQQIIKHYQFDKIPIEGTLYKSTYVSKKQIDHSPISTAIIGFYCHEPKSISTFHRLQHDEVWHFYDGDPFILHLLYPDGEYQKIIMGTHISEGQKLQFVIPANVWQAGELIPSGDYALYGCTMSPGFTGSCFEGGIATQLINTHPGQVEIINRLSPKGHETKMPEGYTQ